MKVWDRMKKYDPTFLKVLKNFLFSVFVLMCIAALICASQYAGDKSKTQLEGSGFERVYYEDIKNSCINFFGMLK